MVSVVAGAAGLVVAGPLGALVAGLVPVIVGRVRARPDPDPPVRLVLLLLLVELRSGLSVLAAIQRVSVNLPDHTNLALVARVATVSGLTAAIPVAGPELRPAVAQLARSQRSGAGLTGTVRRLIDQDLSIERTDRLARARSLPVRLMIPITLLMLPGLVLLLYAPSLLQLFAELAGAWS